MSPKRTLYLTVACGLFIVLLASCRSTHVHHRRTRGPGIGYGPPAHAKAHGHRRQACGYDLIYDSAWGVYVVVGVSDCYYHDGHFYRLRGGTWQVSLRPHNDWGPVAVASLPSGLRVKAKPAGPVQVKVSAPGKAKVSAPAKAQASAPAQAKVSSTAKAEATGQSQGKGQAKSKGYAKGKGRGKGKP